MFRPQATLPVETPTAPIKPLPQGSVDAHIHIVADDFALWEMRIEDPAPGDLNAWLTRLKRHHSILGLDRTVVVHSILYGADNSVTLAAAQALGTEKARAIALVRDGATEAQLDRLAAAQVAGIRLNYVHGGVLTWNGALKIAPALAERGMHIQMLANTHRHLVELVEDIRVCPVPVVFDHIGWPDPSLGPEEPGFLALRELMAEGHVYVKLSGIYRVTSAPYKNSDPFVRALLDTNPERCLWGSDWPHLMLAEATLPDAGELLNRLLGRISDGEINRVFLRNPEELYGFAQVS